jgi:hypothetical protein
MNDTNETCRPAFAGPLFSEGFFREGRKMPPVPEKIIKCVAFLFRTRGEAENRSPYGGTAFVVTKPVAGSLERAGRQLYIPYLVTNRHVVYAGGASVLSINRRDGGRPDIIEYEPTDWTVHPKGDDVAAICIMNDVFEHIHDISYVTVADLLRPNILSHTGLGEDVLMVGRFVNHQGKSINRPAVRFGNISMMLEDIWVGRDKRFQESFAVEMRSRTGFSGAPVLPYRMQYKDNMIWLHGMGILGINWGYIFDEDGENTWLNGVVPAWKITELLDSKPMQKRHDQISEEVISKHKPTGGAVQAFSGEQNADVAFSSSDAESNNTNPTHREDFMRLVGAAARKPEQEG